MYNNNNNSSRIERLEKEKAELASKILRLRNQDNESRNKTELRKKILIGSMVMGLMSKNETLKNQITARLDNFLTKISIESFSICHLRKNNNKTIRIRIRYKH